MTALAVIYTFPPERADEAADHLRRLEAATRLEPGCLMYIVHRSSDEPATFFIYEQYHDDEAMQAHQASEHFRRHGLQGIRTFALSRTAAAGSPLGR